MGIRHISFFIHGFPTNKNDYCSFPQTVILKVGIVISANAESFIVLVYGLKLGVYCIRNKIMVIFSS